MQVNPIVVFDFDLFMKHTHVGDGLDDIVVPLDTRNERRFFGGGRKSDEEYF